MSRLQRVLIIAPVLAILIVSFQNCAGFKPENLASNSNGGNGEPYSGKPDVFYSFTEGFTCKDESGADIPSPIMIIEKLGDVYKLKEEACEATDEILTSSSITVNTDSLDFDFRNFVPAMTPAEFTQASYQFVESRCTETLQSRLLREYGSPMLSPEQMNTAVADDIEITVFSSYSGVRRANIKVRNNVPLQGAPTSPIETVSYIIPDIVMTPAGSTSQYLRGVEDFNMTIARPAAAPPELAVNFEATMSANWGDATFSNVGLSCSIFPH